MGHSQKTIRTERAAALCVFSEPGTRGARRGHAGEAQAARRPPALRRAVHRDTGSGQHRAWELLGPEPHPHTRPPPGPQCLAQTGTSEGLSSFLGH